ncbi:hypothetical protein [Alicyclobacillus dauci]|uniref:Uncharacterized protein n=1 Tax=Alicyclobacillus dauci TaxID=1475485 RepID=A0ABY6Z2I5_9BACL|nr:hypothetical protein [Alicyclobacillus dauci]WAH36955.1 hypothetical protein NZD86_22810 [Alicyclobacillus dauci]
MRLYDKLSQGKRYGEKLDIKNVTYETLHRLWWKEQISDEAIAKLYDVPKKKVTNMRHKWGIKSPETIIKEFEERFTGMIHQAGDDESASASPETNFLIQRIEDLNDIELESLHVELARRFPIFAEATNEVEFLELVRRAVREFASNAID